MCARRAAGPRWFEKYTKWAAMLIRIAFLYSGGVKCLTQIVNKEKEKKKNTRSGGSCSQQVETIDAKNIHCDGGDERDG